MTKTINPIRWLYHRYLSIFNFSISIIRILIHSKFFIHYPKLRVLNNSAFVLGNGPSLKIFLDKNANFLKSQNVLVVNDFCFSEYFTIIKPEAYIIVDSVYWESKVPDDMFILRQKMQDTLINNVSWNIYFFVPVHVYKTGYFQNLYHSNLFINIYPFNVTPFSGPKFITYLVYDKLLAKPLTNNVIGSAVFLALHMSLKTIYLFGVEHSWSRNLFVDDHNRTCIRNEHFYSKDQQAVEWLRCNAEPYQINQALYDIAAMLSGYREINDYAKNKDVTIYNCTSDSFIDAFERKTFDDNSKMSFGPS